MEAGKIPPEILKQVVFSRLSLRRKEVLVGPRLGEDCSVLNLGEKLAVLSSDPITGAGTNIGRLAVHVSCNDLATTGAEPVGILVTILLPVGSNEQALAEIMDQLRTEAQKLNIEILGGHTEVTAAVNQPVISATALGTVEPGRAVSSSGGKAGDSLVLTKFAGLEGTAILAADKQDIVAHLLAPESLKRALGFIEQISVVPEGLLAARHGAHAMHDVTEGGVLGAVFELAEASSLSAELWADRVPVAEETLAICHHFGLDPLGLISSGAMLIAHPRGEEVCDILQEAGIRATVIGRLLPRGEHVVLRNGEKRPLVVPPRDELYKVL